MTALRLARLTRSPWTPAHVLLVAAALILAASPAVWLIQTWIDPSYNSFGGWAAVAVVGLLLWSVTSPLTVGDGGRGARLALALLLVTGLVRLAGRLLAINIVGALALVIDVYAVAAWCGTGRRRRALAPAWLAAVFVLALPMERVFQRVVGFGLQQASAAGACAVLSATHGDVDCAGTRITLAAKDVLVDLPCSGSRGLVVQLLVFAVGAALARPRPPAAAVALGAALAAAWASNTMRIILLALGIAYPDRLGGADVMAQPWHDLIGAFTMALGAMPALWILVRNQPRSRPQPVPAASPSGSPPAGTPRIFGPETGRRPVPVRWAAGFLALAVALSLVPETPIDASRVNRPPILPLHLAGAPMEGVPLSPKETEYFAAFGGGAVKARYGARSLLVVTTTSPLRHLHAPDECLIGSGHQVTRLGVVYGRMPSAVYRSVAPDGQVYRIRVTYLDEDGRLATSVAEVVWRWFDRPGSRWTAIERIAAWDDPDAANDLFDEAVIRAFEIQTQRPEPLATKG